MTCLGISLVGIHLFYMNVPIATMSFELSYVSLLSWSVEELKERARERERERVRVLCTCCICFV